MMMMMMMMMLMMRMMMMMMMAHWWKRGVRPQQKGAELLCPRSLEVLLARERVSPPLSLARALCPPSDSLML